MRLLVSVSRHEHSSLHLPGRSYAFDISTMPPSSGARHNVNVYPNSCCYFSTAQYPEPVTPAQLRACRVRYSVPCFFVLHRCSLLSYATGLLAQYTEKARRRTCTYAHALNTGPTRSHRMRRLRKPPTHLCGPFCVNLSRPHNTQRHRSSALPPTAVCCKRPVSSSFGMFV